MHGGVMSTLVESVCSRATALAVMGDGMAAMGQSISVSFIRPITAGHAEVKAQARHRGRTTWVWDAEVIDADGNALRPRPDDDRRQAVAGGRAGDRGPYGCLTTRHV